MYYLTTENELSGHAYGSKLAQGLQLIDKNKWYTHSRSNIPVGNLGLPLKMGQTKIALPFTLQPKFPDCFINSKHSPFRCCFVTVRASYVKWNVNYETVAFPFMQLSLVTLPAGSCCVVLTEN